jgi:hypothetical protein
VYLSGTISSRTMSEPPWMMRDIIGVYSQGKARRPTGRPRVQYGKQYRRVIDRHANGAARRKRGAPKVITISTHENQPEWIWFSQFQKPNRSRKAREHLRQMLEDGDQSATIDGLARSLKARLMELQCRDAEILSLRHALGEHWATPHDDCPACQEVVA